MHIDNYINQNVAPWQKKKKKTIVQYIYELSLVEKQTINNKGIDISQSNQSVKNQKEIVYFREKKNGIVHWFFWISM